MEFCSFRTDLSSANLLFPSRRDRRPAQCAARWHDLFINLVFGWTVLGWIAALIWAIVEAPKAPRSNGGSGATRFRPAVLSPAD